MMEEIDSIFWNNLKMKILPEELWTFPKVFKEISLVKNKIITPDYKKSYSDKRKIFVKKNK